MSPYPHSSDTSRISWEYFMPKRRERALLYVRESDLSLTPDSVTVESAKQALLAHAQKKGYEISPDNIHIEAISGYHTYYFDRPELMKSLKKIERHEVDVVLVTEIRALSRRGAGEVLVIYNILQKANVRLETLAETITDDPMGEVLLTFRATWARVEREQSFLRMQRGKKDRIEIGHAPPNGKRAYGFILVDTEKETNGRYEYNTAIIHVDSNGEEWSEIKVRKFILESIYNGGTLRGIAMQLNELRIPPPRKPSKGEPCWTAGTLTKIVKDPLNYGEVWVNKYRRVKSENGKKSRIVNRPKEEWIKLPDDVAPALIDKEMHEVIMRNLRNNKIDSLRNNHHPEELGLLRGGYIFCGVCQRRMSVVYRSSSKTNQKLQVPCYRCIRVGGKSLGVVYNHHTSISLTNIEYTVKEKIIEALKKPEEVRNKVAAIRQANTPVVNQEEIEKTLADIRQRMQNIYKLAENATDDETIVSLTERMNEFELQKRETEKLLFVLEDDAEEREVIEKEIQKFEKWATDVQPFLTDKEYIAKASYAELRLAIRILGICVLVYPNSGDYPFRYQIDVTVPEVLAKMNIVLPSSARSQSCSL